jgi:hypothetical protein
MNTCASGCLQNSERGVVFKAENCSFEKIDERLYEDSAKMVRFHSSENILFHWIKACNIFYYDNLSKIEEIDLKWADIPKEWEDPNGGNYSIVIDVHDIKQECLLYNVTIFIATGTIRFQGHCYRTFARHNFPILMDLVLRLAVDQCDGDEEIRV